MQIKTDTALVILAIRKNTEKKYNADIISEEAIS
jgi:hypothetical protein